ncbi:MAG: hypothetical protein [Caudoviricetes sp.]|nr:MAG: hypothetical protein [Caudoviricetes sp.]
MIDLLSRYSVSEILIFLVTFALALKGVVSFYDWANERLRRIFKKESDQESEMNTIQKRLARGNKNFEILSENQRNFEKSLLEITEKINLLIESDKDDIKSYITKEHHTFCYEKEWIDDYSLDCLERRYSHYKEEGGNSFVKDLMEELRELPKRPPGEK